MLNVFNLIQWCFDLLIPAQSPHSEVFVNPRMATLTRGSFYLGSKSEVLDMVLTT